MAQQSLRLSRVRLDGGTQPRSEINMDVVADYADRMDAGDQFPAVTVFFDGKDYWLADGYHRYHACAKSHAAATIMCDVRAGSARDAILFSFGANQHHGLRRSNADKRRIVTAVLQDVEWAKWSDRKIAEDFGLSHGFVSEIRSSLASDANHPDGLQLSMMDSPTSDGGARVGRDGVIRTASGSRSKKVCEKHGTPLVGGICDDCINEPAERKPCSNCGGTDFDEDGDCRKCYEPSTDEGSATEAQSEREPGDDTDAIAADESAVAAQRKNKYPEATDALAAVQEPYKELLGDLTRLTTRINALQREFPHRHLARVDTTIKGAIKNLRQIVSGAIPVACCPFCKSKGCERCLQTGFITQVVYMGIGEAMQAKCKLSEPITE